MIECFCFRCHKTVVIDITQDICPICLASDTLIQVEENDTAFTQPTAE